MTTADHNPSRSCFKSGCPDNACYRINKQYETQLELDHLHGHWRKLDAAQTRNHIKRLRANGWIDRQIAETAHISRSAVSDLNRGQAEVRASTAAAILAIRIGPPPAPAFGIDATGTIRRVQALMYLGHTCQVIAAHTGIGVDKLQRTAAGWFPRVSEKDATTVARAYRQLITSPGRSSQTRAHARKKGWHGPLAWDDIDNPKAKPETGRKSQAGASTKPKVYADPDRVAELTAQNLSAAEIAQQLGCHQRTVVRARRRLAATDQKEAA